jgi:hypothetical protein
MAQISSSSARLNPPGDSLSPTGFPSIIFIGRSITAWLAAMARSNVVPKSTVAFRPKRLIVFAGCRQRAACGCVANLMVTKLQQIERMLRGLRPVRGKGR